MKVLLSVLVVGLLLTGSSRLKESGVTVTGYWTGTLGDSGTLRMYLTEVHADSIAGWVVIDLGANVDSVKVKDGRHPSPDSLYLDVSCALGPPVGCVRLLEGRLDTNDHVTGRYRAQDGHDPPFTLLWSATRVPIAVEPMTWGDVKQSYGAREE